MKDSDTDGFHISDFDGFTDVIGAIGVYLLKGIQCSSFFNVISIIGEED